MHTWGSHINRVLSLAHTPSIDTPHHSDALVCSPLQAVEVPKAYKCVDIGHPSQVRVEESPEWVPVNPMDKQYLRYCIVMECAELDPRTGQPLSVLQVGPRALGRPRKVQGALCQAPGVGKGVGDGGAEMQSSPRALPRALFVCTHPGLYAQWGKATDVARLCTCSRFPLLLPYLPSLLLLPTAASCWLLLPPPVPVAIDAVVAACPHPHPLRLRLPAFVVCVCGCVGGKQGECSDYRTAVRGVRGQAAQLELCALRPEAIAPIACARPLGPRRLRVCRAL